MDSINLVNSYADKLSALEAEVESLSLEELREYWLAHEVRSRIPGVGSKNCRDVIKLFKIVKAWPRTPGYKDKLPDDRLSRAVVNVKKEK